MKVFFTQLLGIALILLGIVSLVLPFLQGILFILLGIYVLSFRYPVLKRALDHILLRFPRIKVAFDKSHKKMGSFFT